MRRTRVPAIFARSTRLWADPAAHICSPIGQLGRARRYQTVGSIISSDERSRSAIGLRRKIVMNVCRSIPVALLVASVMTLTLALAAEAVSRSDHDRVGQASLRYCADPGYCGGNMLLSVGRAEA